MIQWLKATFEILRLTKRIHNGFYEKNTIRSNQKSKILQEAMEAIDDGDILKLHNIIISFDNIDRM